MATQNYFNLGTLSLVIVFVSTICFADDYELKPVVKKDLYICDPKRYETLGINMASLGFCNKNLPYDVRAKDLVDRMTLSEKVHQMAHEAAGVSRLGLPHYNWWSEALHGVSFIGGGTNFTELDPGATSFPTVILTAASFNKSLWKTIAKTISTEARAIYNLQQGGLTFWAPNLNPVRDPRWGRTTETPGEDPYVVGVYAVNFVRGLQDIEGQEHTNNPGSRPLKVAACCKHFAAYDLENWNGITRFIFDAQVTKQDMAETFLPPFESCIKEGDASSAMCSYNRVNGIPACADPVLLKQTLRDAWKMNGYIVSDCYAFQYIFEKQKWLNNTKEGIVAATLKAGVDLECGWYYPAFLENAVKQGKVSEAEINTSLNYLYVTLMRLGYFDGSDKSLTSLGKEDICSAQHTELAVEAAREGIVLLKNDNATLPLNPAAFKTLALIGPNANATVEMIGNYEGVPCRYVSPIMGFSDFGQVIYEKGCDGHVCPDNRFFPPAVEAAKQADATLLVVGTSIKGDMEREDLDRTNLSLPGQQSQLITEVAKSSKGPVILVVMTGGGVDISFAKNDPNIKGILWVGHPGQEGGRAIADVVFGKYNPGGRLPITWYPSDYVDKIPMTSMSLRPVGSKNYPGRTYKFYNGSTVYPFAYGLSYTSFSYKLTTPKKVPLYIQLDNPQDCHKVNYISKSFERSCSAALVGNLKCEDKIPFAVEVKNHGHKDGSEVVMVYSKPPEGIVGTHMKQVVEFERVFIPAGESQIVKFELDACKSLGIVDDGGSKILPSGVHKILLGTSSKHIDIDVGYYVNQGNVHRTARE